jgi:hypothetical protein
MFEIDVDHWSSSNSAAAPGFSDGLPVAVDDGMNDCSVDECLDDAS